MLKSEIIRNDIVDINKNYDREKVQKKILRVGRQEELEKVIS